MSNQDWYAQRLAQARTPAQPQQQPPQYPPTQLPPHLAPYAAQPQPGLGQQGPAGTPTAPPQMAPGQQYYTYNAQTGAQMADDGHVALLVNSAVQTGGSAVVKANTSQCPNCGGTMYAKTMSENGMPLRTPAMSQCGDCNYPVVQAGSHGGALRSAKGSGPAHAARQLPSNHQVTVMDGTHAVTFAPPS